MRSWFQLVRLPNTLTAAADVLAGAALVGAPLASPPVVLAALGSSLLYGGGIALNDAFDAEKDAAAHPERPIPAGRIRVSAALRAGILLLGLGAATGFAGSGAHRMVSAALVVAIVLYDLCPERRPWLAAGLMAACRALNLARGLTLGAEAPSHIVLLALCGHALLILAVTLVSAREDSPSAWTVSARSLLASLLLVPYSIPGVLAFLMDRTDTLGASLTLGLGATLFAFVAGPLVSPASPSARTLVYRAVFTLVLLDALLALAAGERAAALVLGLFLPVMRRLAAAIRQPGS